MSRVDYDAVVIGACPSGCAAAIVLAPAGLSILVCERRSPVVAACWRKKPNASPVQRRTERMDGALLGAYLNPTLADRFLRIYLQY